MLKWSSCNSCDVYVRTAKARTGFGGRESREEERNSRTQTSRHPFPLAPSLSLDMGFLEVIIGFSDP